MERVQFQQEQMVAELKDLVEKKLFTLKETKQILKKHTDFERALIRRVPLKGDFLRYLDYTMELESLRKKRFKRLNIPTVPTTISDYALVKRQFHIFERALKKFKDDVSLWIQYIHIAKKEGARALVGRITARAIQLHPTTPSLYILAAEHELDHFAPSAARALLQRGIRLNEKSIQMWTEYLKMELGFVESLKRRWEVLGLQAETGGEEISKEARNAILDGAIVKSVLTKAVQAVPTVEMFESLDSVISGYPSGLHHMLQTHWATELEGQLGDDPRAIKLLLARTVQPDMNGEELVNGIKLANEKMIRLVSKARSHGNLEPLLAIYSDFVCDCCERGIDNHLLEYLSKSLERLDRKRESISCRKAIDRVKSRLKEEEQQR